MDIKTSIRRKSLAEEVAELIKKQISEGKLAMGDKLPAEPELMRLLGVLLWKMLRKPMSCSIND